MDGSTASSEFAIAARGVRKTYAGDKRTPPKEALKGIDIFVRRGSIFGLLGPNGAVVSDVSVEQVKPDPGLAGFRILT